MLALGIAIGVALAYTLRVARTEMQLRRLEVMLSRVQEMHRKERLRTPVVGENGRLSVLATDEPLGEAYRMRG